MALQDNTSNMKAIVATIASFTATAMLVRSVARDFVPKEFRHYFFDGVHSLYRRFSTQFTIVIEEFQGVSVNQLFEAVEIYLGKLDHPSTKRVRLGKTENDKGLVLSMDGNEEIVDYYENVELKWRFICIKFDSAKQNDDARDLNASLRSELRVYELSFHKKHKEKVVQSYLPHILDKSKAIKDEAKETKFHSNFRGWASSDIILQHPMTFDTLAMDGKAKSELIEDLNNFVAGKEYYKRIGKAWKRGYLLYGPPGTGKSSLIAAMSNYLNYDIYDLDLTEVRTNSNLRSLLLGMSSRSILVIEDIDCSIKLENRESGEEKENRHNRLAVNYLGIRDHELFPEIEEVLEEVEVTPAEVAGELIKSKNTSLSLQGLVEFLHNKKSERVKAEANRDIPLQNGHNEKEVKGTTQDKEKLANGTTQDKEKLAP
nr:AAA-ATPase At3g50940-like [Ipomoea batatas]GME02667.1 AAA-ATPase At3g50940-like [Ipomoea batatas]GME19854.1 AAA-ATPase At3g50940-like [Ipomoea batatas]